MVGRWPPYAFAGDPHRAETQPVDGKIISDFESARLGGVMT